MKRLVAGATLSCAALALQLAMVVRVIEPSLILSLISYVVLFLGILVALLGALEHRRRPKG